MNALGYKYKVDKTKSKTCQECGKIFYKRFLTNKREWKNKRFCSRDCYSSWRVGMPFPHKRRKMTKEEIELRKKTSKLAWNGKLISAAKQGIPLEKWNGYARSKNKIERDNFAKEIRGKVLERDNYSCQMCGRNDNGLQVDHIQPWSEYVEGRFDIDNCRTLCQSCHYEVTFGRPMPVGMSWGKVDRKNTILRRNYV